MTRSRPNPGEWVLEAARPPTSARKCGAQAEGWGRAWGACGVRAEFTEGDNGKAKVTHQSMGK